MSDVSLQLLLRARDKWVIVILSEAKNQFEWDDS